MNRKIGIGVLNGRFLWNSFGTTLEHSLAGCYVTLLSMTERRILVVDDEPKVAFFFQKNLEMVNSDYIVKAVNSGESALQELKNHTYDLMITDLRMPKMDGLELMRRVRQVSPQTQTILVTAYGTQNVWEEAKRLQTFRALSKPLKIPDLIAAVRQALSQTATKSSGILALTGDNFERLANRLEALQIDVGARTAVLADTTGRVLVRTGGVEKLDLNATMALLGGTMAASSELAKQLNYAQPVHLSYFEGPPYDLYATNVGEHFFLTLVYDRRKEASRIGLVWLYTQRALSEITTLLERETENVVTAPLGGGFAESLQKELDSLLGGSSVSALSAPPSHTRAEQPSLAIPSFRGRVEQVLMQFGQQTGIGIESYLDALDAPVPPKVTTLVMKLLSEGLKNVHRHAKASIVGVSFSQQEGVLNGRIADNGVGFDMRQPPTLRTLANLQQTVGEMGGKVEVMASPQQGTKLSFTIPIN